MIVELYTYVERLLVATFPANEYRPLPELKKMTDGRDNFLMNVLLDASTPVGLIAYWDFEKFYYIEYFATDSHIRNKGYGSQALQILCKQLTKSIILEIELPDTEMAIRRKGFYERNNFVVWPNDYFQPPFREGDGCLPILICCHGELDSERDFEMVKRQIHSDV